MTSNYEYGKVEMQECRPNDEPMAETELNDQLVIDVGNGGNEIKKKLPDEGSSNGSDDSKSTEDRPAWDNKFQYIMAALGFAVGLGNIWRFPYLCHKNGGGAFLIPYFLMLLLEGYPLYFLELAIGQKIRKGPVGVWCEINPYFAGVGFAGVIVSLLIGVYYNMILAWALYYFGKSFTSTLPWSYCPTKNGTTVHECLVSSSTSYFWYRETLNISSSIENGGEVNYKMVICLFVAWLLVFIGVMKGIKSSGKVMYFATIFPYIILVAFFIRGMTLEGATAGVAHMFKPDITRLADPVVWREAATQIFFSLGLGYGSIIAYSSYNPPHNNCKKDAMFIATANSLTSVFACITVFSVLGFKAQVMTKECNQRNQDLLYQLPGMEHVKNITQENFWKEVETLNETRPEILAGLSFEECSLEKELDQVGHGTGLAFIAFAETILSFPASPVWAVLFFFMLLNIGMSSEFGILQTFITTVLDSGAKISKVALTAMLCTAMFLVGMIFTIRSGSYFLDLFDSYAATFGLVTVAFFEAITVCWVYGINRFEKDIKSMINSRPSVYWKFGWMFVCPLIMFAILVASLVDIFTNFPKYGAWNPEIGAKKDFVYPWWGNVLIALLILSSVLCIPVVALLHHFNLFDAKKFGASNYEPNKRDEVNPVDRDQPESSRCTLISTKYEKEKF